MAHISAAARAARGSRADLRRYSKPAVAVDVVCLTVAERELRVLAYRRQIPPQKGSAALPGGFVGIDDGLDQAAARLLRDKAGLENVYLEQLHAFGSPGRDPRGRVVTIAYYALLEARRFAAAASAEQLAIRVGWPGQTGGAVDVLDARGKVRPLFLDHASVLGLAVQRLRSRIDDSPVLFQLLPAQFTLRALQDAYEAVLGEPQNKDSFRRRMLASGRLAATGTREQAVLHRPAELYRFVRPATL